MYETNESFLIEIGQRIKDLRVKQGLSQADLAEKAHLALPMISKIENGHSNMWIVTFARIAEALQVSPNDILRLDIPADPAYYPAEFADILSGCTPNEIESILKIAKEVKSTILKKKKNPID